MAFHIVTKRCFLACDKVTSVVLEELASESKKKIVRHSKGKKKKKVKPSQKPEIVLVPAEFCISICYYPLSVYSTNNMNSNRSEQENNLDIRVKGKKEALELYGEIIREVQEQHPTEGYLDQLVDKVLAGSEFQEVETSDDVD